jgi:hypothetical protein
MNQSDIYRKAIRRTFAELYSVPVATIDIVVDREGITVQCAGKTFTQQTASEDKRFVSDDEDPVTVTLTNDEWLPSRAQGLNF